MRRKFFNGVTFIVILAILLCSGCQKKEKIEEEYYDFQKGFASAWSQGIIATPKGYYFIIGNYLYYMNQELSKGTLLCSKAECLHQKEQIEHVIDCDGFFGGGLRTSIGYYKNHLYISTEDITKRERNDIIYKVSLDGTEREIIYNTSGEIRNVLIHRGNAYVYEVVFDENGCNLIINEVCLDNTKEVKVLYKEQYETANINDITCYEDNLYFLEPFSEDEQERKRINLKDGTVSEYCSFANGAVEIDKNGVYCTVTTPIEELEYAWETEYYHCDIDGNEKKRLTEKDFPPIARNAILYQLDEKYIYFLDIDYGEEEVPKEERRLYIYTYDGELAATIKTGEMSGSAEYFPGIGNDMIIKSFIEEEDISYDVYYYVDKETFCGEEVEPKEILRINTDEMSPPFAVTYDK